KLCVTLQNWRYHMNQVRPQTRSSANSFLPVIIAIGATVGAGFWIKNRKPDVAETLRPARMPAVELEILDVQLGSPERSSVNASDPVVPSAAYARVLVKDDGKARRVWTPQVREVQASFQDSEKKRWPSISYVATDGTLLVTAPLGYSK